MAPIARFVVAFTLATTLVATVLRAGASAAPCSNDAFAIEGTTVGVSVCGPPLRAEGAKAAAPSLTETFTAAGRAPYVRRVPLEIVRAGEATRTIDDAPLEPLGLANTLHLTIEYKGGIVRLEHALLVPGAISLK